MSGQRVTLEFEPLPDTVPVAIRVRRLLKNALRAEKLRAIRVDMPEEAAGATEAGEPAPGPSGQEIARPGATGGP
jgi:hypothetical protein